MKLLVLLRSYWAKAQSLRSDLLHAGDPDLLFLSRAFKWELDHLSSGLKHPLSESGKNFLHPKDRLIEQQIRAVGSTLPQRLIGGASYASILTRVGTKLNLPPPPKAVRCHPEWVWELEESLVNRYEEAGWEALNRSIKSWSVVAGFRGDLVQSLHTIVQVARLRREVHKRIIIGFVGSPSAGKDSALKALLGIDTDNINPVAGSTDVVEIYDIDRTEKRLFAINSPGLRDVRDEVSHEASRALRLIDIYVYILNAEGGLQAPELADFDLCRAAGRRTLLLLNKIDCIREKDRSRYIADLKGRLSSDVNVIACAMDPLPSLAMEPIGIDEARLELASHLAKEAKNRGQEAEWKTVIQRLGEGTSISVRKEPLAAIDLVAAKKTTHPRQVIQSPYGSPDDHLSLSVGSTRPLLRVVLLLCLSCASMALVAVLGVLILMIIYLTVVVLSVHSLLS